MDGMELFICGLARVCVGEWGEEFLLSLCHSRAGGLKRGPGVMSTLIRSQEGHLSVVSFNYSLDTSLLHQQMI